MTRIHSYRECKLTQGVFCCDQEINLNLIISFVYIFDELFSLALVIVQLLHH